MKIRSEALHSFVSMMISASDRCSLSFAQTNTFSLSLSADILLLLFVIGPFGAGKKSDITLRNIQDDTKERELLKCVVAAMYSWQHCGTGTLSYRQPRHFINHGSDLKRQVIMVQFLSIFFFSLVFFNFCWVFQKVSFFCVTLYVSSHIFKYTVQSLVFRISSVCTFSYAANVHARLFQQDSPKKQTNKYYSELRVYKDPIRPGFSGKVANVWVLNSLFRCPENPSWDARSFQVKTKISNNNMIICISLYFVNTNIFFSYVCYTTCFGPLCGPSSGVSRVISHTIAWRGGPRSLYVGVLIM